MIRALLRKLRQWPQRDVTILAFVLYTLLACFVFVLFRVGGFRDDGVVPLRTVSPPRALISVIGSGLYLVVTGVYKQYPYPRL